jgi:hypothetical protein
MLTKFWFRINGLKFLMLIALMTFSSMTNSVMGQTVFTFDGMEVEKDLDAMLSGLRSKGFVVDSINNASGNAYLHGDLFKGKLHDQQVTIQFAPKSKQVYLVQYVTADLPRSGIVSLWNKTLKEYKKSSMVTKYKAISDDEYELSFFKDNGTYSGHVRAKFFDSGDKASFLRYFLYWDGLLAFRNENAERDLFPHLDNDEHMNFMGVSLNDSIDNVCNLLKQKGFHPSDLFGKMKAIPREFMKINDWGINNSDSAELSINRIDGSQLVYSIDVIIPCKTEEVIDYHFNNYKEVLDAKYGKGRKSYNKETGFTDYNYRVANSLMKNVGFISLAKNKSNDLRITYLDSLNGEKYLAMLSEKQAENNRRLAELKREQIEKIANDGKFHFVPNTDGTFTTIDGRQFYIVRKDKQSAHKIYEQLCANVSQIFINPDRVISGIPDKVLIVNGLAKKLSPVKVGEFTTYHDVFYRIEILIKDGRLRVNTPLITKIGLDTRNSHGGDLDYKYEDPTESLILMVGDDDFKNAVSNAINPVIYGIVYGVQSSYSSDNDW